MTSYDVVIAGGGMVGAALACALGESGLQVALVEGREVEDLGPEDDVDLRVSAITHASQRIFAGVGAWDQITRRRVSPFREMRVWDSTGSGRIHFDSAAIGEPLLGWIIENRVIQYVLLSRARALANVDLWCPATIASADAGAESVRIQLEDGRVLEARLLVGADGANSKVRHWAGIATTGWGYDQQGLVATVATEHSHQETAWQRFMPSGPLAFLPLHDGRCSIVWSTSAGQAERLQQLDERAFAQQLGAAFEWQLGDVSLQGARAVFPLRSQYAQAYVRSRIALVGDAVHVVHPLAGQGVNLGLLDAAALAEVLTAAIAAQHDVGSLKTLRRYERWRKGDNMLMLGVLDGFKRLFGSPVAPARWLRNVGLSVTNSVSPLKNEIARRAMGLAGDLPRLARRESG